MGLPFCDGNTKKRDVLGIGSVGIRARGRLFDYGYPAAPPQNYFDSQ